MTDFLLLTPVNLFLITTNEIHKHKINIDNYLKNTGDSLKLSRTLLTKLKKIKYPYMLDIDIKIDKTTCKNRLCSKVFYEKFNEEFNNLF